MNIEHPLIHISNNIISICRIYHEPLDFPILCKNCILKSFAKAEVLLLAEQLGGIYKPICQQWIIFWNGGYKDALGRVLLMLVG